MPLSRRSNPTAWALAVLRRAGIRRTPTQAAVLDQLSLTECPVTHAELASKLAQFGHEQSTVFRCLRRLVEKSLARQLELGDLVQRYELTEAALAAWPPHPHFLCVSCGKMICLHTFRPHLPAGSELMHPEIAEITEVFVKGYCVDCRY